MVLLYVGNEDCIVGFKYCVVCMCQCFVEMWMLIEVGVFEVYYVDYLFVWCGIEWVWIEVVDLGGWEQGEFMLFYCVVGEIVGCVEMV